MRISDRTSFIERVGATQVASVEKPEAAKKASAGVEVKVSARAQELAAGASRLEELRAQVRDGTYRIDHQKIAAALVGSDNDE